MKASSLQVVPNPAVASFNADEYWHDKPIKKWVVILERQRNNKVVERDKLIVSASNPTLAKRTAAANTMMNSTHIGSCRLATPIDLDAIMMVVREGDV